MRFLLLTRLFVFINTDTIKSVSAVGKLVHIKVPEDTLYYIETKSNELAEYVARALVTWLTESLRDLGDVTSDEQLIKIAEAAVEAANANDQ